MPYNIFPRRWDGDSIKAFDLRNDVPVQLDTCCKLFRSQGSSAYADMFDANGIIIGIGTPVSHHRKGGMAVVSAIRRAYAGTVGPCRTVECHQLVNRAIFVDDKMGRSFSFRVAQRGECSRRCAPRGDVVDNPVRLPTVPAPVVRAWMLLNRHACSSLYLIAFRRM